MRQKSHTHEDNASEDAPTNTGEASVDAATYRVADDVTITLVDADLKHRLRRA